MEHFERDDEFAKEKFARVLADAQTYRAYFDSRRRVPQRRNRANASASILRAVEATTACRWQSLHQIVNGAKDRQQKGLEATLAIAYSVRGDVEGGSRVLDRLEQQSAKGHPDAWAVLTAARCFVAYAIGREAHPMGLPTLVENLIVALYSAARPVRELLCFSLALAAYATSNVALASLLLGCMVNAVASSRTDLRRGSAAKAAALGFCIVAVGDAATGRRLLLGVDAIDSDSSALYRGIVDAELVRLQVASGDTTSAAHWLGRSKRFAERYGCSLISRRAVAAMGHLPLT